MYTTDMYEGMLAETITMQGHNGDAINAYFARPLGSGPFPGVVLIHHLPGWDEWYREATRRFAHHGYLSISPNLYHREGSRGPGGRGGEGVGRRGRTRRPGCRGYSGGDEATAGAAAPQRQGRGVRDVLGGAARDAHGGTGVGVRCGRGLLGRPGSDDARPAERQESRRAHRLYGERVVPDSGAVRRGGPVPDAGAGGHPRGGIEKHGKDYEFHRYPNAGHGFFYYHRPAYRAEHAVDGWGKIWDFFGRHLS